MCPDMTTTHRQYRALRALLPVTARRQLKDILKGQATDVDVAIFAFHLPAKLIWPTLLYLRESGAPSDLLQKCIRCFWKHEKYHQALFNSAEFTTETVREMFRQAQFPPPSGLPPLVQVWRGTAGKTKLEACKGLCWTRDRDVACWYATLRNKGEAGTPLVVTAHVRAEQILFSDDESDGLYEQEVVLNGLDSAEIDSDESDWIERGKHFAKKKKALQQAEMH